MATEVVLIDTPVTKLIVNEPNVSTVITCSIGGGGSSSTNISIGGGALFISDVTPASGGIVSSKIWENGTVPIHSVITECTSDKSAVNVWVYVEGDSSIYTPEVFIDGVLVTNLVQDTYDKRTYTGYVQVSVLDTRTVIATTSGGLTDEVIINKAANGPEVYSIVFGSYPGSQTELKAGDIIFVTVTTQVEAISINFYNYGAVGAKALDVVNGVATGILTVSGNSGILSAKVYATNSFGTNGLDYTSTETLVLNQTYPSISTPSISYPSLQNAIKNNETAVVTASVTNFDTVLYTHSSDISMAESSNTYNLAKNLSRVSGNYIVSGSNYTITANRAANNATSIKYALVKIVNVAPTAVISIDGSPSTLRSKLPSGKLYTLRVNADQQIVSYNSLDTDKGTLSSFSSNSKTILIQDSTVRGIGTFSNLSITGLSNIVGTVITGGSTFMVGGFELRQLTYGVISNREYIGTYIRNFNKVRLRLTGTLVWFTRLTSTADVIDGFTITNSNGVYDPNGDYAFLTSTALVNSNSSGTLKVDVEEEV